MCGRRRSTVARARPLPGESGQVLARFHRHRLRAPHTFQAEQPTLFPFSGSNHFGFNSECAPAFFCINHRDDEVDSYQQFINKELSLFPCVKAVRCPYIPLREYTCGVRTGYDLSAEDPSGIRRSPEYSFDALSATSFEALSGGWFEAIPEASTAPTASKVRKIIFLRMTRMEDRNYSHGGPKSRV